MNPNIGTLALVKLPHTLRSQYLLCGVSAVACAVWLPGWWKLLAVPLGWWGLSGLGLMPSVDITPLVLMVNCAAPTLRALGSLM